MLDIIKKYFNAILEFLSENFLEVTFKHKSQEDKYTHIKLNNLAFVGLIVIIIVVWVIYRHFA